LLAQQSRTAALYQDGAAALFTGGREPQPERGNNAMSTTAPAGNGAGQVGDLFSGFAAQAVKLPAVPGPDANAAAAYSLGWSVGDALTWCEHKTSAHLKKVAGVPDGTARWNLLIDQILFRCGQLQAHLTGNPAPLDLSVAGAECSRLHLDPAPAADAVNGAVNDKVDDVKGLKTGIAEVLWATESSLAKAYELGLEMQDMCAGPIADGEKSVVDSVASHAKSIHKSLITLASKLPPNAAHATDNSLRLWGASLHAGGEEDATGLLHQGWRWHAVLSGEVGGKDGLRLSDYIGAADGLSRQLRQIALQAVRRFKWSLLVAVIVILLGVAAICFGTSGSVGAGITAVLATLGVTWKGIGEFLGRAMARGEEQLWEAELDWAIAYRFTKLRNPPQGKALGRRSVVLADDRPIKAHLARYNEWKANWPDVDLTPSKVQPDKPAPRA
jgi:hypothetical protein